MTIRQIDNPDELLELIERLKIEASDKSWEIEKNIASSSPEEMSQWSREEAVHWKESIQNKDASVLDNALKALIPDTGGKMKIFLHGPYKEDRSDIPQLSLGLLDNEAHLPKIYQHIMAMYPMLKNEDGAITIHVDIPDPNDLISFELHANPNAREYHIVEHCKGRQKIITSTGSLRELLQETHVMVHQRAAVVPYMSM